MGQLLEKVNFYIFFPKYIFSIRLYGLIKKVYDVFNINVIASMQ